MDGITQTEQELRDLTRRFIFQGGSPFAVDLADHIVRLRAENEMLRARRYSVLLYAAEFFGWFNRHYPAPSSHPEHPWCAMGMRLSAYADELAALRGEGE